MPSSQRAYEGRYNQYLPYLKNKKILEKYNQAKQANYLNGISNALEIRSVQSRERKEQKKVLPNRKLSPLKKKVYMI